MDPFRPTNCESSGREPRGRGRDRHARHGGSVLERKMATQCGVLSADGGERAPWPHACPTMKRKVGPATERENRRAGRAFRGFPAMKCERHSRVLAPSKFGPIKFKYHAIHSGSFSPKRNTSALMDALATIGRLSVCWPA